MAKKSPSPTKDSKLNTLSILCGNCKDLFDVEASSVSFSSTSSQCDICGNHGEVELDLYVNCPHCGTPTLGIKVSEW